jgi:hypothetical protein
MLTNPNAHYTVTVRAAQRADRKALRRLAQLDSRRPETGDELAGRALVAESDGELLAAVPLTGGAAIADPFQPTADIVSLLRARRSQLESRAA